MIAPERGFAKSTIRVFEEENGGCCKLEDAKRRVSRLKGVLNVDANHMTCMLYVEYDPEKVTVDQIRKAVK